MPPRHRAVAIGGGGGDAMARRGALARCCDEYWPLALVLVLGFYLIAGVAGILPSSAAPPPARGLAEAAPTWRDETFGPALAALPPNASVLLEFFASWCPACQHFAPTYERLGLFFRTGPGAAANVEARASASRCSPPPPGSAGAAVEPPPQPFAARSAS